MKLTKLQRAELKNKFGGHCAYCGEQLGDKWHADHLIAIRRNGDGTSLNPENDNLQNMMPACTPCNYNKRSLSLENWRDLLAHYRDVQVIRDCSQFRHLVRFGLIEIKSDPVFFFFERYEVAA